jgi:anti-sigma regulatory factor (Ser/Thr protein kinase)
VATTSFTTSAPQEVHVCREPQPIPFAEAWCYELQIPRDPRGPRVARMTLRAVLATHSLDELAERAEILTSELATNAVRYTTSPAIVSLTWLHPTLRVCVWDASPKLPTLAEPTPEAVNGRGLWLLEALADRWGSRATDDGPWGPGGKTTWFELLLADKEPAAVSAVAAA